MLCPARRPTKMPSCERWTTSLAIASSVTLRACAMILCEVLEREMGRKSSAEWLHVAILLPREARGGSGNEHDQRGVAPTARNGLANQDIEVGLT